MSIFPLGSFLSEALLLDEVYPGRQGLPTKQEERQERRKRGLYVALHAPTLLFCKNGQIQSSCLNFFLLPRSFK